MGWGVGWGVGFNYNEVVRQVLINNQWITGRVDKLGLEGKKRNNLRDAGSSALVFCELEDETSLSDAATKILFVVSRTKGEGSIF